MSLRKLLREFYSWALYGRAAGLHIKRNHVAAKAAVERSLAVCPDYLRVLALALKGQIEFALGEWSAARATLSAVIADAEANPGGWKGPALVDELARVRWTLAQLDRREPTT